MEKIFPDDFLWGAASAAFQVEGARNEDGRTDSIWDALTPQKIRRNENGDVTCDHYHRWEEDVELMKELGLKSYRFSISWSRVMPERGKVNEKGLAFYVSLVSRLREAGIEPLCTLYHWDLPMWLHEEGGWENPRIVEEFEEYTKVVVDALSDKVGYWMTFNEPACFIGLGYFEGRYVPFRKNTMAKEQKMRELARISKNVLLCHGKSVQIIRKYAKRTPKIGAALNARTFSAYDNTPEGIGRARENMFNVEKAAWFAVNWWADPMILGKAPVYMEDVVTKSELSEICQPLDFFGFNCYFASNYEADELHPDKGWAGMPRTQIGWPISPDILYWAPRFLYERYHLPILITENGMANIDFVMSDGKVHDPQRIEYLKAYLGQLQKAMSDGIPVIGYTVWSFMDNFEWTDGFDPRFGLVYVDYRTQKRTPKDSFYWYQRVIRENGDVEDEETGI